MGQKQIVPFTKFDKELAGILTFLREKSDIFTQIVQNSHSLAFFGLKICSHYSFCRKNFLSPSLTPTLSCGENPAP